MVSSQTWADTSQGIVDLLTPGKPLWMLWAGGRWTFCQLARRAGARPFRVAYA